MNTKALRLPILATLAAICLLFAVVALIEGTASLGLFAIAMRHAHLAEERFTERDTLLGWISTPNASRPDFFGRGRSLHVNAQRFRHRGEVAPAPPAGKTRVVCSGDSFTLGYGVDDRDTWCARLAAADSGLETVNMGQGGYGIDQAYLWYVRDGLSLRPAVHVFAFIAEDFRRMGTDRFAGFPKPRLAVDGGRLHTVGVPVPSPGMGPFMARLSNRLRTLRSSQLLEHFVPSDRPDASAASPAATLGVAHALLRDLAAKDSVAGAKLVVVFLPTIDDFMGTTADRYRRAIGDSASSAGYAYVDLVDDLRRVPPDSVQRMFIPRGQLSFRAAAGHYSEAGNAWVERQLRTRVPLLASR